MKLNMLVSIALLPYSLCSFAALESDSDKLSYSLGVSVGEQLNHYDGVNINAVIQGIQDRLANQGLLLTQDEVAHFKEQAQINREDKKRSVQKATALENLRKSQDFLNENGTKPGVVVLESGLQYRVINKGSGVRPAVSDLITVHYEGRRIDGTIFESSYLQEQPENFQLNRVIAGWTEGIQLMPEGSIWEFFIPPTKAYGSHGIPGIIAPNEALVFKVELIGVKKNS